MENNLGNIKRYAVEHFTLVECKNGALVKYEDIEKIKAELREIMEGKKGSSNWGHVNKTSQA